jgi:hypothetical protein
VRDPEPWSAGPSAYSPDVPFRSPRAGRAAPLRRLRRRYHGRPLHRSGAGDGSPSAADPVTWTKGLCASIEPVTDAGGKQPEKPATGDPGAALDAVTAYLDQVDDGFGASLAALEDLGPSPVANGDALVAMMSGMFVRTRERIGFVQETLGGVDRSDPAAVKRELTAAGESLRTLGTDFTELGAEAENTFSSDGELNGLLAEIPECGDFRTFASIGS